MNARGKDKNGPTVTPARALEQQERKQRLAEALRENLRKRKDQKREQAQTPAHTSDSGDKN